MAVLSLELPQWHRVTALCASPVWPQWHLCFQVLREQLGRAARKNSFVLPVCLAQCELGACNLPGKVAFLKTTTARCCPQNPTSPALKCHSVAMKLLSLGVVVSGGQVCTLPSPQLCSIPLGILQVPRPAPVPVCVSPTAVVLPGEVSQGVTCCMVPFIPFSPPSLSLCLHGCSCGHVPSSLGATEPPQSFLHQLGAAFPSVQLLAPRSPGCLSEAAALGRCRGTFPVSPAQGPPVAPLSQAPASLHTSCACHRTGERLESSL